MAALLNLFWDICLLRKGPQDVPAAAALLQLTLLAYALTGLATLLVGMPELGFGRALLLTLTDLGLLAGLTYLILSVLGLPARFGQTLTALTGVGTLLQLIALPLGLWYQRELAAQETGELPALLWLLLLAWSIAITGHILRHAFAVSFGMGILYAVGYLMSAWTLSDWLLPAVG
ncbi:MAG: hypothetical protein R3202_00570 [Candidatus Competibacterales bacterium]|nr:hypothetical protein [Candidatus Competibacterales bacterium]